MKAEAPKTWNLKRLDAAAFAAAAGECHEVLMVSQLDRLAAERFATHDGPATDETIHWSVRGELREGPSGGAREVWMHLQAKTVLPLTCQRCLGPVQMPLEVDRWFRFVADEATAEALDADSEEDLLPLEPRPNLIDLLEDELLMGLPLVSLHEQCPVAVPMQAGEDGAAPVERPNPFAALAQLKR